MDDPKPLTCHRCGSADLVLSEVTLEYHTWYSGLDLVDGVVCPRGEALHNAGDIQTGRTRISCENCGHQWRPRRQVDPYACGI